MKEYKNIELTEEEYSSISKISRLIAMEKIGAIDAKGQDILVDWINSSADNEKLYKTILSSLEEDRKNKYVFDKTQGWECLQNKNKKKKLIEPILRWVAVFIVLIGASTYMITKNTNTSKYSNITRIDINSYEKVVLKLDNGKKLQLDLQSGEIPTSYSKVKIYNDSTLLSYKNTENTDKAESLKYNEVYVPERAKYQILLSDGSKVYLNSKSNIRFPVKFAQDKREVEIEGEVFFEVKKYSNLPFIVKTKKYDIKVLGTEFNVSAYEDDDNVVTTLKSGSILIEKDGLINPHILSPNQEFSYNKSTEKSDIKSVDTSYSMAWLDNKFRFRDLALFEIMKIMERKYGIKVIYEDEKLKHLKYGLNMSQPSSIEPILSIFEKNGKIKIEKYNNTVRIKPGRL